MSEPRCLVCDAVLTAPTTGGRMPKFCSGAHRALHNRARSSAPRERPEKAGALADAATDMLDVLAQLNSAGERLILQINEYDPAAAAAALAASEARDADSRAALEENQRQLEAVQRELHELRELLASERRQLEQAQRDTQAAGELLTLERQLRDQITRERDRLLAETTDETARAEDSAS